MGIKQKARVRVCKTKVDAGLTSYGNAEVWVAQFLVDDLPVYYTNFCSTTASCNEEITTLEAIYMTQWDFAPTAGAFVVDAWDRVYGFLDPGGPMFPVPAGFRW